MLLTARSVWAQPVQRGRLKDIGKGRIKLWWDLGREGKTSVLVRDINGLAKDRNGTDSKHKLTKNKEHRIRIENDAILVKMFFDGELVWEGKEINGANKGGRIALGTHATAVEFSDFVITDLKGQSVEPGANNNHLGFAENSLINLSCCM